MDRSVDAFGVLLRAEHEDGGAYEIVERDDGHIDANPASLYFQEYEAWSTLDKQAADLVDGRTLDVGCGAGRHALHLQETGHDVVGLDVSPGALSVANARGLEHTLQRDVAELGTYDGEPFETVCMLGNNFGLLGTRDQAPAVLEALANITREGGRLLAQSLDPYQTDDPAHRSYHERNQDRGRFPGAIRMGIWYKLAQSDWFAYLLASPDEMEDLAARAGWQLDRTLESEVSPQYVGVLERAVD